MTHLIQENRISTQWPHVHTMLGAALFSGARKRRSDSASEKTLAEGILGIAMPSTNTEFSISIPMSLPAYIVELNTTSNEDQGQAGQVT